MANNSFDVAVIGAGMVGVSSALWLQRAGFNVVLVDKGEPGQATSFGNAGVFADYSSHGLNDPSLPLRLPAALFGKYKPVRLRLPYSLTMMPWFIQFLMQCRPKQAHATAAGIEELSRRAKDAFTPLMDEAGLDDLVEKRGIIQLYKHEKDFAAVAADSDHLNARQYRSTVITPGDLSELEPNVKIDFYKGVFQEDAWSLLNPGPMVGRLAQQFVKYGGNIVTAEVKRIKKRAPAGVSLVLGDQHIDADQVVLAAGAFSTKIKGSGAERLPLDTERGYHVMYDKAGSMVSRPVGWMDTGVFVSPINGGIRAGGTVEFGGLTEDKSKARLKHIANCATQILPDLKNQEVTSDWVGHRPTLPDCLPVIGRTKEMPDVILAFGHQHLGMTLAGITGKLVSEIAAKKPTTMDLTAYSPERFGF